MNKKIKVAITAVVLAIISLIIVGCQAYALLPKFNSITDDFVVTEYNVQTSNTNNISTLTFTLEFNVKEESTGIALSDFKLLVDKKEVVLEFVDGDGNPYDNDFTIMSKGHKKIVITAKNVSMDVKKYTYLLGYKKIGILEFDSKK